MRGYKRFKTFKTFIQVQDYKALNELMFYPSSELFTYSLFKHAVSKPIRCQLFVTPFSDKAPIYLSVWNSLSHEI